jgi:hypothetical protein
MKFANNGKSVACGAWTSEMKTHFRVSVAHCSNNEEFNKKFGKHLARCRMELQFFIVLPAKESVWGGDIGLKQQLTIFLELNC